MPTYEYACSSCGIVEAFQAMRDEPLKKCPKCKRCKVVRIFSGGAGVIFKGSGFWETDYNRSSDYKTRSSGDSAPATPSSPDTAAKPATKVDNTPATKTKSPPPASKASSSSN
ncbi:MAG: zinc ribbon domain-containing protein [Planctomycetes bacterium]|nr:zinc ribbon domain-containing protein [Planctomycetota bacterium]